MTPTEAAGAQIGYAPEADGEGLEVGVVAGGPARDVAGDEQAPERIAATRATLDAAGGRTDLVLERGYAVTLRARLSDGTPAPWGQLAITTEDGVPL
jgi:hypothetical protein